MTEKQHFELEEVKVKTTEDICISMMLLGCARARDTSRKSAGSPCFSCNK